MTVHLTGWSHFSGLSTQSNCSLFKFGVVVFQCIWMSFQSYREKNEEDSSYFPLRFSLFTFRIISCLSCDLNACALKILFSF